MHWIFAHLIGDYLIQNDWMAKGKKTSSWICFIHVFTYMLPFLFVGATWWQLLAIGTQHFVQDRTHIVKWFFDVTGKSRFGEPPMAPWSLVLVDNIFHILFIALVLAF